MPFAPPEELPNPAKRIIPHPCSPAAEDRNWDAVTNILNEFYNSIRRRGSLLAEAEASVAGSTCSIGGAPPCTSDATINLEAATFVLYGEDDVEDPIETPTQVDNNKTLLIQDGDIVTLVYNPNDGRWKIIQNTHKVVQVLTSLEKIGGGLQITTENISTTGCQCPSTSLIATTTKNVIKSIRLADGGTDVTCQIKSIPITLEVFAGVDDAEGVEWSYMQQTIMSDVYQTTPTSDIYGFYVNIFTPCREEVGELPAIDTVSCTESS